MCKPNTSLSVRIADLLQQPQWTLKRVRRFKAGAAPELGGTVWAAQVCRLWLPVGSLPLLSGSALPLEADSVGGVRASASKARPVSDFTQYQSLRAAVFHFSGKIFQNSKGK